MRRRTGMIATVMIVAAFMGCSRSDNNTSEAQTEAHAAKEAVGGKLAAVTHGMSFAEVQQVMGEDIGKLTRLTGGDMPTGVVVPQGTKPADLDVYVKMEMTDSGGVKMQMIFMLDGKVVGTKQSR